MNHIRNDRPGAGPRADAPEVPASCGCRAAWLLWLAAAGIPLSLLWDFSWESTVGIDRVWAPAHVANYLAVALAGAGALALVFTTTRAASARDHAVRLGRWQAPLGAWLVLWGAAAFVTAVWFDRWWQSAYGLAAGIWHPPQILKAVAFFAVTGGVWLLALLRQNQAARPDEVRDGVLFAAGGGLVLAMISVVTLPMIYPNRQHSATFYQIACGLYPIALVAVSVAGKFRWSGALATMVYAAVLGVMLWLLPLFPARPQAAPIYQPLDHLMPPPFPLLLLVPALAIDALLRHLPWPRHRGRAWLQAGATGAAFFVFFLGTQWAFAEFLLSDLADNRFFAGGGRHWPYFLKIEPAARVEFWETQRDPMNLPNTLLVAGLALLAARLGLWLGGWMQRLRR